MPEVLVAFALTLGAGLATSLGGLLGVFGKVGNTKLLSLGLGFSAGVMVYISLFEILPKGRDALVAVHGEVPGNWVMVLGFFGGIALIAVIDQLVPASVNPHEPGLITETHRKHMLLRTGLMTALALGLHNFPEGFANFVAGLQSPEIAVAVAVAIALHNIPEGLAVAVPVYHATGSRRKALWWSSMSGLAEPVGALIGYLLLFPFMSDTLLGVVFAGIAGIMVFISLDELLPAAEEYGAHHLAIYGVVAGMAVMAVSLVLLAM